MVLLVVQQPAKSAILMPHMIFSSFGIPKYLVSDNGRLFAKKVIRTFAENAKVNLLVVLLITLVVIPKQNARCN